MHVYIQTKYIQYIIILGKVAKFEHASPANIELSPLFEDFLPVALVIDLIIGYIYVEVGDYSIFITLHQSTRYHAPLTIPLPTMFTCDCGRVYPGHYYIDRLWKGVPPRTLLYR